MKNSAAWIREWRGSKMSQEQYVLAIQADALRHAQGLIAPPNRSATSIFATNRSECVALIGKAITELEAV